VGRRRGRPGGGCGDRSVRLLQVIDVGTNSVRSIVVEVPVGGPYRVVDDEKDMTRLGEGLERSGALSVDAMDRTVTAIRAMASIGSRLGVAEVRAVATEAARRASNGAEFVARVREETAVDLEVVAPEEEGRLVWLSAATVTRGTGFEVAVDIGGGSVELVQALDSEVLSISSMRLGARVLAERYVDADPISDSAFKQLKRGVKRTLKAEVTPLDSAASALVGSGGTISSIAAVIGGIRGRKHASLQGVEIGRAEVMQLLGMLSHSSSAERLRLPAMPADRADIIMPGAVVLAEVMKLFGASGIIVNARGIREGIVIDTLACEGRAPAKPDVMAGVLALCARYRFDRAHATQVTRLALSIFDQAAIALGIDVATRPLLEAAAMLHDIGYYVAYDRHHEHTYHLVVNSTIPGLTRREQGMVASIARYHTKSLPKPRHESWSALDPVDRPTVRSLAAILRLADGLDRGRAARVDGVEVIVGADEVRLLVRGVSELDTEVYGSKKKRDLFEESFGRRVVVEAVPAESGEEGPS
jgi:exopolyphosphatase/guanosine-5'-triphosphate,3'-diphosphate pyrophosphatase